MTNFERVKKFMETFGQEIKEKASFPNNKITSLRYDLIKEICDSMIEMGWGPCQNDHEVVYVVWR